MFTLTQSQESITMIKKCKSKTRVDVPKQKDGSKYSLKNLPKQQQAVAIAAIDTIVKFLKNDKKYATIDTFLRMIDRKEVPLSVTFQYLTTMKYA